MTAPVQLPSSHSYPATSLTPPPSPPHNPRISAQPARPISSSAFRQAFTAENPTQIFEIFEHTRPSPFALPLYDEWRP